jgi:hypothetical protein
MHYLTVLDQSVNSKLLLRSCSVSVVCWKKMDRFDECLIESIRMYPPLYDTRRKTHKIAAWVKENAWLAVMADVSVLPASDNDSAGTVTGRPTGL